MASYPTAIITYTPDVDYSTVVDAAEQNSQWAEIAAIETVLGLNPATIGSGTHVAGTVGYNIDTLSAEITVIQGQISSLEAGSVVTVTAADTSIVMSGTGSNPKVATATLDVIATNHPPAANWSNNSKKITSIANGSSAQDAAAFGQLPTLSSLGGLPLAGGTMSGPIAMGASKITGLANGSASSDAAAFGQLPTLASLGGLPLAGGTMSGPIAMGASKITGLANGSAASDAAAFGQIPTWLGPRVATLAVSSNTYTPNCGTTDLALIVSPTAAFTVANPTGAVVDGQRLIIRINSGSTGYAPSWGGAYIASGIFTLFTTALPASKNCTFGFIYDLLRTSWVLLAADSTGY